LTIDQLDWKTRMNIALNAAQGKWFNLNVIIVEQHILQTNVILF
jgi:hypothetical protein